MRTVVIARVVAVKKFSNRWYKEKCNIILKNKDNVALKEKEPLLYDFIQDLMEDMAKVED